ncbi:MAG: lipoyl synthase [Alphaproteobacteria bacterium GM202ARS2]|nr:lipoyl synthase [Alphaproteobacteria bacterium GM202ARS2]
MTAEGAGTVGTVGVASKPDWLRVAAPSGQRVQAMEARLHRAHLNTVCYEAACPNRGACWQRGHAAFMIMGTHCTRKCAFCNVPSAKPTGPPDADEPQRLADTVKHLRLHHVVITSPNRDDLADEGASHFAACVTAIRQTSPHTTIELLVPDFLRNMAIVLATPPDVLNHNLETVPRLYRTMRAGSRYYRSLRLLHHAKERQPQLFTKSGLMVGLGESKDEVLQVMDDLRAAEVDFLTIGQYLRPTLRHAPVVDYITPETFQTYQRLAEGKGFLLVSASPLTRSSFHADSDFERLKRTRAQHV